MHVHIVAYDPSPYVDLLHVFILRTGALRARLVRLVQPAKVETVQVLVVCVTVLSCLVL